MCILLCVSWLYVCYILCLPAVFVDIDNCCIKSTQYYIIKLQFLHKILFRINQPEIWYALYAFYSLVIVTFSVVVLYRLFQCFSICNFFCRSIVSSFHCFSVCNSILRLLYTAPFVCCSLFVRTKHWSQLSIPWRDRRWISWGSWQTTNLTF